MQTSTSADEINQQVKEIQTSTSDTSEEMAQIKEIILEANQRVGDITHAIDEQSGATREISRNIHELSDGFTQVGDFVSQNSQSGEDTTRHIFKLKDSAEHVKEGAMRVDSHAGRLLDMASGMTASVQLKENA